MKSKPRASRNTSKRIATPAPSKGSPKGAEKSGRDRLLAAMLEQVAFDGWTQAAYDAALKQTKLTKIKGEELFPRGIAGLVEAFGNSIDAAMQNAIARERGFARLRTRDKTAFALKARFAAMQPYREAARRLMIWYAMPLHAPQAARRVWKTTDLAWVAAGDTDTDFNYYTKRILLGAVWKASMLYWLADGSDDGKATDTFVDNRIGDVMKFGKSLSLLKEFDLSEIAGIMRGKVRSKFGKAI